MLDKTDAGGAIDDLPGEVRAAQRRVRRAVCVLPPPANFTVLVEQMAQEMVHAGLVPGAPFFEPFLQMQIGALVDRIRGICHENGVELFEAIVDDVDDEVAPTPAPRRSWWPWRR